jgi:glycosyltransferase involved in cell wall biosynthesis
MKNSKPRVSIGIPVYNGEKYLEQALESILTQTFTDFEVIISDNASTDQTQKICQAYQLKDDRIHYFRSERNLGAAPNYNRVFELSTGDYFKWAAYDDLISPDFLLKCVEILDADLDAVLCFPRVNLVNELGDFIDIYNPEPDTNSPSPYERFRNLMFTANLWIYTFGLIRADIIKKTSLHGSYPSSDEVFILELALQGRFHEIPERLFNLRIHPEQSTRGEKQAERSRITWFDTSLQGKTVLPKWLYFLSCLSAIKNASINSKERFLCYLQMGRWLLIPAHFRAMGKDLLLASWSILLGSFMKLRGRVLAQNT